ncbi:hypothetical protein NDA13_005957 [Ustilago tritici]|nr:hypothetical protein NDA13_005957 [Ustilago tritici]
MPFSPKPHTLFTAPGRRRKSLATATATATATAEVEVEETLSSTISSHVHFSHTHVKMVQAVTQAQKNQAELTQPPQTHTPPTASGGVRRPSALFKAWKSRRGSASTATTQQAQVAAVGGRRKSSALTGFLPTSTLARGGGVGRVDKHSLPPSSTRASSSDDTRRRSLSIICRGHRDSDDEEVVMESHTTPRHSTNPGGARGGGAVTAAMAIRDTWLYSSHQYSKDGRKGSVSTVATSPSYSQHLPRKSFSGVGTVGLHMENDERQQRVKGMRKEAGADADSVVSLSLTEEIALYTTDDRNRRSADSSSSTGQSSRYSPPKGVPGAGEGEMGGMTWNMPNWNTAAPRLPEQSPAPAIMIADPFAKAPPLSVVAGAEMQRVESGSLDPVLSPIPASSPSLENDDGEEQAGLQWDTTSPFTPSLNHRPSMIAENHSPTAPNSPPLPTFADNRASEEKRNDVLRRILACFSCGRIAYFSLQPEVFHASFPRLTKEPEEFGS